MSKFRTLDEVVAERHRLERRLTKQGAQIQYDYERFKENPFSLNGVGRTLNRLIKLRYIIRMFRRK